MTIISAIPPLVDGNASNQDEDSLLSILCYWVLPYVLLGLAGLVSGVFPPWFEKRSAMIDKREADETPQVAPLGPEPADTSEGPRRLGGAAERPRRAVPPGGDRGAARLDGPGLRDRSGPLRRVMAVGRLLLGAVQRIAGPGCGRARFGGLGAGRPGRPPVGDAFRHARPDPRAVRTPGRRLAGHGGRRGGGRRPNPANGAPARDDGCRRTRAGRARRASRPARAACATGAAERLAGGGLLRRIRRRLRIAGGPRGHAGRSRLPDAGGLLASRARVGQGHRLGSARTLPRSAGPADRPLGRRLDQDRGDGDFARRRGAPGRRRPRRADTVRTAGVRSVRAV